MSELHAFLHPAQTEETQEVTVSRRFLGEDGRPVPFKIRPLTQEENEQISRKSTRPAKDGKRGEKDLDEVEYSRRLVVAATVEPDFRSEELCRAYGTLDPLEVPGRMLRAGEYNRLMSAIMRLSGFSGNVEDEAKN